MGFWKSVVLSVAVFGGLGFLIAIVPTYSQLAAAAAAILCTAGVITATLGIRYKRWQFQLALWEVFLLCFMGMGMRGWAQLLDRETFLVVLVSAGLLHVIAWAFPWIFPHVSSTLAREQLRPTTFGARFVQAFSMSLIPGIGGLAYLAQRMAEREGLEGMDVLLIAVIGSILAIGGPQAISHQYWEKKPWALVKPGPGGTGA